MKLRHGGNAGDVIYSLPATIALLDGRQGTYLVQPDLPARYKVNHPCGQVRITRPFAKQLLPLLQAQPWCEDARLYAGEVVDYDLDKFRDVPYGGDIARWCLNVFPVTYDLSKPYLWVEADDRFAGKILFNLTPRYPNPYLHYRPLTTRKDVVYVGLQEEYRHLRLKELPCHQAEDFLQLARWIKGCRVFIGGQSFPYAIAEALKVPRICLCCPATPNVIPTGPNAYSVFLQECFEEILCKLLNKC